MNSNHIIGPGLVTREALADAMAALGLDPEKVVRFEARAAEINVAEYQLHPDGNPVLDEERGAYVEVQRTIQVIDRAEMPLSVGSVVRKVHVQSDGSAVGFYPYAVKLHDGWHAYDDQDKPHFVRTRDIARCLVSGLGYLSRYDGPSGTRGLFVKGLSSGPRGAEGQQ